MCAEAFGTAWSKQYCTYERATRLLQLQPYSQMSPKAGGAAESVGVAGARAAPEPQERRFCWEAVPAERERAPLLLQALGERDRRGWLRAATASSAAPGPPPAPADGAAAALDEAGFEFARRLVAALEARGLEEQGLYRVAGVASKVARLVAAAADPRRLPPPARLHDPTEWESRTLTSALKSYLRALPDRLLTRRLHRQLIQAAQSERRDERVAALHALVRQLPPRNRDMLALVLQHLRNVAARSDKNLMSASNLAVCWGPTLLRADTDTVASILELKFCNVLVETMLEHYHDIFEAPHPPHPPPAPQPPASPAHNGLPRYAPPRLFFVYPLP